MALTDPTDDQNPVVVPHSMAPGNFNPESQGQEEACTGKQRPQPNVQRDFGVDIAVDSVVMVPWFNHVPCLSSRLKEGCNESRMSTKVIKAVSSGSKAEIQKRGKDEVLPAHMVY